MDNFRQVMALVLHAELDRSRNPPFVDHDCLDFKALRDSLIEVFNASGSVRLRLPDDTIDQVTALMRSTGRDPRSKSFSDFGEALLKASEGSPTPIPVRKEWGDLHYLSNRSKSPPPALLPFIVDGHFEDVQAWIVNAKRSLKIGACHDGRERPASWQISVTENEGKLPAELVQRLSAALGVLYQQRCDLVTLASDQPPG